MAGCGKGVIGVFSGWYGNDSCIVGCGQGYSHGVCLKCFVRCDEFMWLFFLAYVDSGYRNEAASKNIGSTFFLEKLAFHVC